MIDEKQDAHADGNRKLYHKLKNKIPKEIKKSKQNYSQKIQQHLAKEPANAWRDIKKLSRLQSNNSSPSQDTKYTADDINTFFARFEKPNNQQSYHETADIPTPQTAPTFDIDEDTVLKSLKLLNPQKGVGPDKIIPKVLKTCATGLSYAITKLYSRSIKTQTTPIQYGTLQQSNHYQKWTIWINLNNTVLFCSD